MKSLFKKGLAYISLASALLFNPMASRAQTIDFRIGDVLKKNHYSELGEPLRNIEILLRDIETGNNIATLTTDAQGRARYSSNSVISPDYNFNMNEIASINLFDVIGRHAGSYSSLNNLPRNNASGSYFYRITDSRGNGLTGKLTSLETDMFGLPYPFNAKKENNPKRKASINTLLQIELNIRDENTDEIGNYYDIRDTINVDENINYEVIQDLIPVWDIEEDTVGSNYRNNLHQIKWMTQTDRDLPDDQRRGYVSKWDSYPANVFYNRQNDQGYNVRALETAINNWESSTEYEGFSQLDLFQESNERPDAGILMDYTTMRASGTAIADAWFTHNINGQRYYSPRIITVYIGNTLGRRYDWILLDDTNHELGHAVMASRAHSINQTHIMTGGGNVDALPRPSEGKTLRYIVLEKPFTRTWKYLED